MALRKCPDCGNQISTQAEKCLKCGRAMIYWTPGRILIGVLMVVFVFGIPSYCLRVTFTPTNLTGEYSAPDFITTKREVKNYEYKIGDAVNLGDKRITVFGFQPYSEPSMKTYYKTSQGIAMDVLIENIGDSPFLLSPLHFTVQDNDGRSLTYYDIIPGGKSPALHFENVAPGQSIRAFITYADNKKPAVIYYKSLENQTIKFDIPKEQSENTPTQTPLDKATELFVLLGNKTFDTEKGVAEDAENIKAIKTLIKRGVDINSRESTTNATLLIMSAAFNRPQTTKIIIESGADVNAQNKEGQTALMYAAYHNNLEIARSLLERGANVNLKANSGLTALAVLNAKFGNNFAASQLRQLLEKSGGQ